MTRDLAQANGPKSPARQRIRFPPPEPPGRVDFVASLRVPIPRYAIVNLSSTDGAGHAAGPHGDKVREEVRITSYNVCYTKLLRKRKPTTGWGKKRFAPLWKA